MEVIIFFVKAKKRLTMEVITFFSLRQFLLRWRSALLQRLGFVGQIVSCLR